MTSAIDLLKHVADPLSAGVGMSREIDSSSDRREFLRELLTRHGDAVSAGSLGSLSRLAADVVKEDAAGASLLGSQVVKAGTAGGCWFAASILEARKQFAQAGAALLDMPDRDWSEMRAMRLLACARNRIRAGEDARQYLRDGIRCAETRRSLTLADRLIQQAGLSPTRTRRRMALLGTGSLQFWPPVLRPVAWAAGIQLDLHVGEFGQYRQEILDPASPLEKFNPEIVILALDWSAVGLDQETAHPDEFIGQYLEGLRSLWKKCATRWGASVIQHNFEIPEVDPLGRLSGILPTGRARILQGLNSALADSSVAVLDIEQIAGLYGKQRWSDAVTWVASKQYPHPDALPFLARRQVALIRALCGLTTKCAVLDLDGTLWGGTIGEDGVDGIRLGGAGEGEAFLAFQRYLLGLRDRGIPLAVCSKNNHDDAMEPFLRHPEILLKPDDIAVFKANWEPKPDNLRAIAATLNIGLDSLVFIDDHPVERARVRAELPEVEVPEMPADPALYATALHRTLLFESLSLTAEDKERAAEYRHNVQRQVLQESSAGIEDFLAGLAMRIELRPFDQANLPRIVQLINKTNQFNLTTRRASAAGVEQLIGQPAVYTRFMRLSDRFGDSGITGILVAHREGSAWRIDQWLLSCRVLGRRVEDVMLTSLLRHAVACGASEIIGEYVPTAKNAQVASLYPKFGFKPFKDGFFRLPVSDGTTEYPAWATVQSDD